LKKIRKIIFIVLLLLLLLSLALAFVIKTFDPNDLKPRLQNFFAEKYQRKLDMPGDLKIALFPLVHIESGPIRLMEKNGTQVFASIESANISLQLMPLIDGRLDVNHITLEAPSLHVKRLSDGTTNIDDFLSGSGGATPLFDIKGLKINRATWTFDDQQTRWQLSHSNFEVGRLANGVPTEFTFDGDLASNQSEAALHIVVKSPLRFDLNTVEISLPKLDLNINGKTKAANKTSMNDVTLHALGGLEFHGAKKQTRLNDWQLQSHIANGDEKWHAQVSFAEALQEGKNWHAKNITSQADQQTAAYTLNTTLTAPTFNFVDAHMSGKEIKLVAQWDARPDAKKSTAHKNTDSLKAVLSIGALDDMNDTGDHAEVMNLQTTHLDVKGVINHAPVTLSATGDVKIVNNNQILTKNPWIVNFNYQAASVALEGVIKTEGQMLVAQGLVDLKPLVLDIKILPADFKQALKLKSRGTVHVELERKMAKVNLQGALNEAKLESKVAVNGFTPPTYTFDIFLQQFNTAWLESKSTAANKPSDLPDLNGLKKLNANGVIQIGELISSDKRATNVRIDVKSEKGE
jgi:AsmA protein